MLPSKIAFVDIETTGTSVRHDRIIEIAIIRMVDGVITDRYETLINPQRPVSPFISELTTIYPHELEHAPVWEEVAPTIQNLLEGYVFAAHNVRFDYGFVKEQFRCVGIAYHAKQLCTVRLSRALYPQFKRHNLDTVIERHGFVCGNRHRAMGDTQVIADFYLKMISEHPEERLVAAITPLLQRPSLPPHISPELVDAIPEKPGIYIFYGEKNTPLYIGKSKSLRTRVLSHFQANHTHSTEMHISQQTVDIVTETTSGELGALLLEQHLIKTMLPLYNRKLRRLQKLVVAKSYLDNDGYMRVRAETVEQIDPHNMEHIIGIYKNRSQMNQALRTLAVDHMLCQVLMGLEKGSVCFGYKIERCRGACCAKEPAVLYNARFQAAIALQSIKKWPYETPMVVLEQESHEYSEGFVIDKWCMIGKIIHQEQDVRWEQSHEYVFDLDVYKILSRTLLDRQNRYKIVPLTELMGEEL